MVIGDDSSVAIHEKAGAEDVDLEMGSRSALAELHHAFFVDQRLASSIVEQADAGAVVADDG